MDKVIRVFENPEITRELNKNKVKVRKAHVFYVQVKYQLSPKSGWAVDTIFQSLWLLSGFSWQRVAANKETTESRVPIVKLKSLLWKFYGRQHDLVNCYGTSVSQMTTDMFHLSLTLLTLPKHLSSPPVFSGVCFTRSLVLCVMFCRSLFVLFLLAIMLSVHLRFTDSDYHFGIFKLFLPIFRVLTLNFMHNIFYLRDIEAVICIIFFPKKERRWHQPLIVHKAIELHNRETMVILKPKHKYPLYLTSPVRKWQNTVQQGVDIFRKNFKKDTMRRFFKYMWLWLVSLILRRWWRCKKSEYKLQPRA